MKQAEFISNLLQNNKEATVIGSLGTISYDLDQIDHPHKICIRGAMGCAMAVGLGYAMAKPEEKVFILIGDGAFLMKAGTLATLIKYRLPNLYLKVLNNGMHKSTGGQKTNFKHFGFHSYEEHFETVKVDEISDNQTTSFPEPNSSASGSDAGENQIAIERN